MITILGFILTMGGAITLITGVFGAFGSMSIRLNPWILFILEVIFLFAGIGLLKYRNDTVFVNAEK